MSALEIIKGIQSNKQINELMEVSLQQKKSHGMSILSNVIKNNYSLQNCTPISIAGAVIDILAIGLSPLTNTAYIIPYKTNATVQIGVHGLTQLALRSKEIAKLNTGIVYEGEFLGVNKLTGDYDFSGQKKSDTIVGYFAYLKLNSGFEKTVFYTAEQMHEHFVKFSKNNYDEKNRQWMESKSKGIVSKILTVEQKGEITVLKQILSKWAPKDTYIEQALITDGKVYDENGVGRYVDKGEIDGEESKPADIELIKAVLNQVGKALKEQNGNANQKELQNKVNNLAREVGITFENGWYGVTPDELKAFCFKAEQEYNIEIVVDGKRPSQEEPESKKEKVIDID